MLKEGKNYYYTFYWPYCACIEHLILMSNDQAKIDGIEQLSQELAR